MNPLGVMDQLLINLALLIAGVTVITLTYRPVTGREPLARLGMRYASTVTLTLLLITHSAPLAPGLMFDFRSVVLALVTGRYGFLGGLLVALPIAAYRLWLGGLGAPYAVAQLAVILVLASRWSGWRRDVPLYHETPAYRRWWQPLGLFTVAHLTILPGLGAAGYAPGTAVMMSGWMVLLSTLGYLAAHAVKQSRLRAQVHAERLKHLAYQDALTGVSNRRRFDDDVRQAAPPAYLILLDLDHFKHINDTYGHDQGDRVLRALGRVLQESVRPTDGVYRLGGEEFAVLLAPCEADMVEGVAERIRQAVQESVARRSGLLRETITLSGGVVPWVGEKRAVLRAADELLYQAKANGRNRLMLEPFLQDLTLRGEGDLAQGTPA